MQNLPPIDAQHAIETWAEVRAHDQVMRYSRAGTGPAVLVLRAADAREPLWPPLIHALRDGYRTITPDLPGDEPSMGAWLAAFLEGLGIAAVTVIATGELCIAALELVLLGADQVARLVLVPDGHMDDTGLGGALAIAAQRALVPLLVIRRAVPAADALPRLLDFIDDEAGAAT